MKKIISLIAVTSILLMGLVSCNIETSRPFQGDLKIEVRGLPPQVKAVSMWGTPNEWKLANIEAEADKYIVDVVDGTATFKLGVCVLAAPLWCQFVPMTSKEMAMNDSTWWQLAFSGSDTYANAENNLVYNFSKGASESMVLVLDIKSVYGNASSGVFKKRFNTDAFQEALKFEE
jgi:hypothetical protein